VAIATAGLVVGAPSGVAVGARAVKATPSPVPFVLETPRPVATIAPTIESAPVLANPPLRPSFSSSCPQARELGGPVRWQPSDNAGPWPTNETVSIPTIGTSAPIVRVGVDSGGQMVIPPNAQQVAWLDQGVVPPSTNNTVLAGHVTWAGVPGAFHRIGDLLPGDMIVLTVGARRLVYRTTWVCEVPRTSDLAARIMGSTDLPSVTLITCAGSWDAGAGTHSDRIVARAVLVY
jgi:hypothetical protein